MGWEIIAAFFLGAVATWIPNLLKGFTPSIVEAVTTWFANRRTRKRESKEQEAVFKLEDKILDMFQASYNELKSIKPGYSEFMGLYIKRIDRKELKDPLEVIVYYMGGQTTVSCFDREGWSMDAFEALKELIPQIEYRLREYAKGKIGAGWK